MYFIYLFIFVISINPVAPTVIVRALKKICMDEKMDLSVEQIEQIGESSGGDIRSAVNSLQFLCLNRTPSTRPVKYSLALRNSSQKQKTEKYIDLFTLNFISILLRLF